MTLSLTKLSTMAFSKMIHDKMTLRIMTPSITKHSTMAIGIRTLSMMTLTTVTKVL